MATPSGVLVVLLLTAAAPGDGSKDAPALNLADLAPYRAALDGKPGGPPAAVSFRDLWDRPEEFRGRRVRVEGRVVRRFRQGAFGTFPPLVEVWAVSPSGDPLCLVFPDTRPGAKEAAPGASVRFEGVFLRTIRYQGGDSARLAPLVVGGEPPSLTSAAPMPNEPKGGTTAGAWGGFSRFEWGLGLAAAGLVAAVLAGQYLRKPVPPASREEPPEFVEES